MHPFMTEKAVEHLRREACTGARQARLVRALRAERRARRAARYARTATERALVAVAHAR